MNDFFINLNTILLLVLSTFTVGQLSNFLTICFKEGYIFENWTYYVASKLLNINDLSDTEKESLKSTKDVDINRYKFSIKGLAAKHTFWFKPLGGCGFCMNVWISFVGFMFCFFILDFSILLFLPFVMCSVWFFRILNQD